MHSWTSILRRVSFGLAVLGVAGAASAQLGDPASNSPACCQLTTSLVNDVIRGKDVAGDERFFSAEGAPPNIHFLIDTSGSMKELPQIINSRHTDFFQMTTNGCNNPRLDAFLTSRGWNPATVYPQPDLGTGLGSDTGFPNLFQDSKYYGYMYWDDSTNPTPQWDTPQQACQAQVPNWNSTNSAEYTLCLNCLATKGYFKQKDAQAVNSGDLTNRDFIFWGRLLNFNPPKYVTAKAVLKQVIKDLRRVRAGYSYFTNNLPNTAMGSRQNPSCDQIIKDSSAFDNNRASYINGINGLTFSTNTPLARSLLNVGYYFTSGDEVYRDQFGFGTGYSYPSDFRNGSLTSQGRSVCWGCQVSSIIIITDGEPTSDTLHSTVVTKLRALNKGPVYCPDLAPCNPGTTNSTRDKGTNPDPVTGVNDDNPLYMLDDVAKLLYEQDLQSNTPPQVGDFNTAGRQSVSTYTVGFGINSNLLKNTAKVGGGLYYTADDAPSLKQALLEIISNVQTRATSFSSPAASTLQVRAAGATLIPRFKPSRNKNAPWQGFLYRFNLGPERLLGCNPSSPSSGGDLNNDGDCDDTHLIDTDGHAVIENDEGDFVKYNAPLTPAKPFWEAGKVLRPESPTSQVWKTRRIYTLVDSNNDGRLDRNDTPVEFTEANVNVLRPYLGISDNPNTCSDLATKLGVGHLSPVDCAKLVIRWYRGADALNPDPSLRDYDRPFLLHDIFHSSPVSVDPPMSRLFCDFSNQCTYTLYTGATEQQSDYTIPDRNNVPAYDKYVYESGNRDKVVLVGSNGGMLHAIHNGSSTSVQDQFTGLWEYNAGTGQELWAFVPPDMLPKLRPNIDRHAYFVDGTPMVREIWMDGVGGPADGKKQWQEYRTVAVVGSGRGGVHRFALDLTRLLGKNMGNPANVIVPNQAGDFLWMWPQPCDALALQVGESFSNFSPRPPPIGPVPLTPDADDALRSLYNLGGSGVPSPWKINGVDARERWVVALNGGYDQHMSRGRGFAIVDMHSGHTLWSFFHGDGQPQSEHLRYPIGAGLSMLDIGRAFEPGRDADLLWDTGTVGDYGGQLWTLRLWNPGEWNGTTQRITNWHAARSFRVANLAGKTSDPEAMRAPFSYMTLNTIQPETGYLRTFAGTGDRENLLEKGTVCRLSNPRGCAVQGCAVNTSVTVQRGGSTLFASTASYNNFRYASGTTTTGTGGAACGGAKVTLNWNNDAANGCSNSNDGSIEYLCDGNSSTWSCRETTNTWTVLNYAVDTQPYPQRFYGVWTYGGDPQRTFNTAAEAAAYDSKRLDDSVLVNIGQFDADGKVLSGSQQTASPSGPGWYLQYGVGPERSATSGTIVNGCVLWNSFEPSGASGVVCSTTGTNISRLYQSNYATGLANCAEGFYDKSTEVWARYIKDTTVAAPAEPTPQLSIGGGEFSRTIVLQSPGSNTKAPRVRSTSDGMKSLYQLELDRRGHDCRHEGKNCY